MNVHGSFRAQSRLCTTQWKYGLATWLAVFIALAGLAFGIAAALGR